MSNEFGILHDCFPVTELVTMEDLGRARKCFGHPIGASGLRMIYETYLQLEGRAGKRKPLGRTTRPRCW